MSAGLPVVCSSLANQGIQAEPDREILIGKNSLHFAEQVIYLIENPEMCRMIGSRAREFVKNKFKWENVIKRFEILETELKRRR